MQPDTFLFIGGKQHGRFHSIRDNSPFARPQLYLVTLIQFEGEVYTREKVLNPDTARIFYVFVREGVSRNGATARDALLQLDNPPVPGFLCVRERMVEQRRDAIREMMGI